MRPLPLAALLALCVALSPASAQEAPAAQDAAAAPPTLAQDPSPLASRIAARLVTALKDPCLVTASVGLTVRDARDGSLIFERKGGEPLKPASNMKLVTGAAAQDLLGPERVLRTAFRGERAPDKSGAVGTLYVKGGGDPSLTIEGLYLAARALAMRGVRKVDRIVVDDSFFAGTPRPPTWPARNHGTWYGAPSSALGVNFNVVAVHVRGGGRNGEPAATWLDPFPTFFDLASAARTGSGGVSVRGTLVTSPEGAVSQRLAVAGRVRPGKTVRVLAPVEDPAIFCGHGVAESLRRVGIDVAGGVSRGMTPQGAVMLHEHQSAPMAELVRQMNKPSSNMFAETLLKLLGAELHGEPGTREKGIEVLRAWLEVASPGGCGCLLADGSGLSPDNRVSTRLLTDVLLHESTAGAAFPEYLVGLPISGVDGTLRRRFRQSHARRLVRAKTGRISQVAALSGWARIGDGREAVFSLLVNAYHCPTWKAEGAVDRVIEALVLDAPAAPDPRSRLNLRPLPDTEGDEAETEGAQPEDDAAAADEAGEATQPESPDGEAEEEQRAPPG